MSDPWELVKEAQEKRRIEMIETITTLLHKASFEKVDVVYRIMVDL